MERPPQSLEEKSLRDFLDRLVDKMSELERKIRELENNRGGNR